MEASKIRELTSKIKYIYILVYLVCFSIFNNVYINAYMYDQTQLLYQGLVLFGVVLIAFDFFTFAVMLKTKYSIFLVLFYIVCMLSVLFNLKYDPISNIKVIAWMLIQTFVFAAVDRTVSKEHHRKYFKYISEAVALVWFVFVVWSIVMFFAGISYRVTNDQASVGSSRVGFYDGRLFGVFTDPNYASICVLFSMLMILCNMFLKKEHVACKVYHIIMLSADLLYVLLSRSRTAELCIIASMCMVGFFASKRLLGKYGFPIIAKSVVMVLSAVIFACGSYLVTFGINYVADQTYIALRIDDNMTDKEKEEIEHGVERDDVVDSDDVTNNRAGIWKDYLSVFGENALLGTGPRNGLAYANEHMPDSYIVKEQYQYHNGYLAVLVGTGILGFLTVMVYIFLVAKKVVVYLCKKANEQASEYLPILILSCVLVIGAISALPLHIVFFNNSACDVMFWFVLGYVLYMVCDGEAEKNSLLVKITDFLRLKKFKSK